MRIAYNPLYKPDGKTKVGALTSAPINDIVFDLPGKSIWAKGLKFLGTDSLKIIIGSSSDTVAGTWTGQHSEIGRYEDGLTIIYIPKVAGASTTTLNINGLGAKTCYFTGTSKLTTHYPAGTPILFTYYNNGWRRADYDSNTNYYRPIEVNDSSLLRNNNYVLNFKSDGNISYTTTAATSTSKLADLTIGINILNLKNNLGVSTIINNASTNDLLPTSKSVYDFVGTYLTSYMHWKGNTPSLGTTFTIPNAAVVGDAYRIAVAGTIPAANSITGSAQVVEVGDIIICTDAIGPKYTVAQTNWTTVAGTSTLTWNSEVTLAIIGGLAIKAKLPVNPTLALKSISFTKADGTAVSYNGSSTVDLTGGINYATLANLVRNNLIIKLNGGATEGTNLFTYNGSAAKTINITPVSIGAATSGHTHTTTIAASTDTNQIALVYGGKYKLTAGGTSYVFTMPTSDNTWRPIGTGATDAAAGNHTHDGRYLRWNGSAANVSAMTWGTLTSANGYTILSHASSSDGGDVGFVNKDGKIFMLLDGYYYLNEGRYRVLDTSDFTAFSNAGSLTTRITIGGVTKDLKIDADTIDGYHAAGLVKFYLSPMTSGAPADSAKSWFVNTMPSASGAIVYNVPGSEKTIIAGKSSGAHGHMLQLNYDDNYLRILRYYGGSWKTTNWEKISAGYADSAGKTSKTLTFTGGSTATFNGSADVSVAIPTKASWNYDDVYLKLTGGTITGVITFARSDSYGLAASANYSLIGFVDRYFWKSHINITCTNNLISLNENGFPNAPKGIRFGTASVAATSDKVAVAGTGVIYIYNRTPTTATSFGTITTIQSSAAELNLTITLPSVSGILALTSQIPNVTNYYWANLSVQSSASDTTVPSFGAIRLNGASSAGTNYITGIAGRIFFGGNFHIDSLGSNKTYINYYSANDVYLCSGSSQGKVGIGTSSPSYKLHVSGDSYTTGLSRAATGFYVEGTGVHFSNNSSYPHVGEIDILSNNEFCWGADSTSLYFNYRQASRGNTVTHYLWHAGNSSSYASHTLGALTSRNDLTLYGLTQTCNKANDANYMNSALQIREYNFGGALSDTWAIAPRLSWHWAGRVQAQIGLASNNHLYISEDGSFSNPYLILHSGNSYVTNGIGIINGTTITQVSNADTVDNKHASDFATSGHTHGLTNSKFFVSIPSQTEDLTWKKSFGYNPYNNLLMSVRINSQAPIWCVGDYGSGILYGGDDTKGFMSSSYHSPRIMWAGGNGFSDSAEPVWYMGITGASGVTYNLANFSVNGHTHAYLPLSGGTMTGAINWTPKNLSAGSYSLGLLRFDRGYQAYSSSRLYFPWIGGSDYVTSYGYGNTISIGAYHSKKEDCGLYIGMSWDGYDSSVYMTFSRFGDITASHFYESSDIRQKTDFSTLTISTKELSTIPLFDFSWKEDLSSRNTGTSAQAVQSVLPNLVTESGDYLKLDYGVLGTIAGITACKELVAQKSEIELLKKRIELLEQQLKMYHGNSK